MGRSAIWLIAAMLVAALPAYATNNAAVSGMDGLF